MDSSVFAVGLQNANYLAMRQSLIAGNIAQANVPGYRALDVRPFADALERPALTLGTTDPGHIALDISADVAGGHIQGEPWETYHSGGNVTLEQEMIKAGEVMNAHRLNVSVIKTFHGMFLAAVQS
jgi:flagellar basal-body rod protein FlgB